MDTQLKGKAVVLPPEPVASSGAGLGNVAVTGTPAVGKIIAADSPTQASWKTKGEAGLVETTDPQFSGTMTLSSAGARIRGDFSNAAQENRVAFQSSVLNGVTGLVAMPNGTATTSAFNLFNSSDILNASVGYMNVSSTHVRFGSGTTGSGTSLPLALATGFVDRQTILPTGEVGIGVTPAVGQGTLQVQNVNGAATSGFRNKIINGCCRISKKGSGAAALGFNGFGADGINTYIGGWSAVTGTIAVENAADFSRTSSGGTHVTNITAATGGVGYITHIVRIEAADALELAGRPFTVSARITSWTKQIDDVLINVLKANTFNNFGASTLVANVAGQGPVSANTTKDVAFSTTLTTADCANGLQIEFNCYYNSAVTAAFHCVIADLQCCAGSLRMPFELRPIAIEEQLRRRYYQKRSVRVNTSSNWTCFPIDMAKTPTITGGGAGFTSTGTTADTLMCYQTTAAAQTLILDAEL